MHASWCTQMVTIINHTLGGTTHFVFIINSKHNTIKIIAEIIRSTQSLEANFFRVYIITSAGGVFRISQMGYRLSQANPDSHSTMRGESPDLPGTDLHFHYIVNVFTSKIIKIVQSLAYLFGTDFTLLIGRFLQKNYISLKKIK